MALEKIAAGCSYCVGHSVRANLSVSVEATLCYVSMCTSLFQKRRTYTISVSVSVLSVIVVKAVVVIVGVVLSRVKSYPCTI